MAQIQKHKSCCQSGHSLLEAMIALLVFSIGLTGLTLLQLETIRNQQTQSDHSRAIQLAAELAEQINANPAAREAGLYDNLLSGDASACPISSSCTPSAFATAGFARWQQQATAVLPDATSLVCADDTPDDGHWLQPACDGGQRLAIKLWWLNRFGNDQRHVLPVNRG